MQSVCPECKTANPVENLYCSKCGSSMEGAAVVQEIDAASEGPPQGGKRKKKRWPIIIGVVVALCLCGAIAAALMGGSPDDGSTAASTASAEPTAAVEEQAPAATPTKASAPTEEPAPTEPPPPVEPVVFLTLEGTDEVVSDNFEAPACEKAVFAWTTEPNEGGVATLILKLQKAGSESGVPLVNALEMDGGGTLKGLTLQALDGGSYFVTTENLSGAWSVQGTCYDGAAPVGSEVNLDGRGDVVTENYALPMCGKSVIVYTVEPNSGSVASLIVGLQKVGAPRAIVVNALEMDVVDPQSGEALVPLAGGTYFFTVENASGPWTVAWECRD